MAMSLAGSVTHAAAAATGDYDKLVSLSNEWRQFAKPAIADCLPDYSTAAMAKKAQDLKGFVSRLDAIKPDGWPQGQQIDYRLFKAELNGMDFDLRVLKPWARDPTFYASVWSEQSDVPEHEGPSSEPIINLYEFTYPLSQADQKKMTCMLGAVPKLLEQAKANLKDSQAHDLFAYGTRAFREQSQTLKELEEGTLHLRTLAGNIPANLKGADKTLLGTVQKARAASDSFRQWLDSEAPGKKGQSGVGKENYDWYMKNVHLVPYTWEQQATLLRRELERSRASLALEEFRNRKLPQLEPVATPAAYKAMADAKMNTIVNFLIDGGIVPDKPYYRDAMQQKKGGFTPLEKGAGFFSHTTMRNPLGIYSHNYHWIELARIKNEPNPSPIRSLTPVSDMYDSRSEGLATAVEELLMHAGMYDDDPRGREIVWIMAANRAARGLASLYVQSNDITLKEAGAFHARWTPRKWSEPDSDLVAFEQLLYLRQPGYGTSYITGKILLDRLVSDYSAQVESAGKAFDLSDFFKRFNAAGIMPYPLIEAEMVQPGHMGVPVPTK